MDHRVILRLLIVFVLLSLASGPISAQDDTREFQIWTPNLINRFTFEYSTQIAEDAVWNFVPASRDFRTPTGPIPECWQVIFQNYSDDMGWVASGPMMHIYPTVTFPANADYPYPHELANLQAVLAARPAVPDRALPMLPIVTATQLFRAQVQYLDFPNGAGIRYITAAGLDRSPLSNPVVFYTFQGLTNDGAYYVAAQFPLHTAALPDEAPQMTTEEYEAFAAEYDSYITGLTQQLDSLEPGAFEPALTVIDDVFESLAITKPTATIVTPENVETASASYGETRFSYDAGLASRIEVDVIPPFVDTEHMTLFGSEPAYTVFSLFDFPALQANNRAQIRVIPVDTFPGSDTISDQQLAALQAFLAERPTLAAQTSASGAQPIPVLPPINAAQVFAAQPAYLNFQNGFGARFITHYSQGIDPITNDTIWYQFIGMTDDGQYVVSAAFPVIAPVLPEIDYTTLDYDAFASNYVEYVADTLAALDGLESSAYTPALGVLDSLIQSVQVGG